MARQARQAIANIPYHIIHRGNNHQTIFFSKNDYQSFIHFLRLAKEKYPCKIYSFILMTNHIHLLLEPVHDDQNLAKFMKHVTQRYAQYVNKLHQRTGTLWEGRFKSSAISTDHYLLACSRYIEMNAVRAGIVKSPEQHDFNSYKAKIGLERLDLLDFDPVYLSLGDTEIERQNKYQKWFLESISGDELDMVREAIQRNWPYGNEKFKERIENELGQKFQIKTAGRKPKM